FGDREQPVGAALVVGGSRDGEGEDREQRKQETASHRWRTSVEIGVCGAAVSTGRKAAQGCPMLVVYVSRSPPASCRRTSSMNASSSVALMMCRVESA